MHCIVPFAAPGSEAGRAALAAMQWPRLSALLPRLTLVDRDDGEATTFTPPHERVLARALGWPEAGDAVAARDGCWPFAARAARADGIDPGRDAWGLVSPVHWHVGTDQVSLVDPAQLALDDATSRALFEAVKPLFVEPVEPAAPAGAGSASATRFVYGHATRWYAAHESLDGLRTASLDRVAGRNVDAWLGDGPALRRWRRLQAEVQMLLHAHPLNAEREARGLLPVNSFWLSGCGRERPQPDGPALVVDTSLRAAALAEDWRLWADDWRRLEEGVLLGLDVALRRGSDVWLTLAGERSAVTFAPLRGGIVARFRNLLARPAVGELLASL